jgi:RHS repeat-associated protein
VGITAAGVTWSAVYDGDGVRLGQAVNGVPVTYTLDLAAPLVTVLAGQGISETALYLYGLGDSPLAGEAGGSWTYLSGRDGLNSVRQEMDGDGAVTAVRSFDPYGVPLGGDGGTPFGYAGEIWDNDAGLTWLRARWLSEAQGRFFQPDSFPGDPERPLTLPSYAYAGDDPVNAGDPTGQVWVCADGDRCGSIMYGWGPLPPRKPNWAYLIGDDPSNMDLSQAGLNYTKSFEVVPGTPFEQISRPYNDSSTVHNCTIGYGIWIHNGPCCGDPSEQEYQDGISPERADELYRDRLQKTNQIVQAATERGLTQLQFDALVDFGFNAGNGALLENLALFNRQDAGAVSALIASMRSWVNDGAGEPLLGLVQRRAANIAPFEPSVRYRFSYVRVPRVWYERAYGEH